MSKASLVVIFLSALVLVSASTLAQDGTSSNGTSNETPTNASAPEGASNETPATNETPPDAPAGPPAPVSLELEGLSEGGKFFFRIKGETQANPALRIAPGAEVTVTPTTLSGGVHNFCTSLDNKCSALATEGGDPVTFTFTAPAEGGSFEYWCSPHKSSGMTGKIEFTTATGGSTGGGSEEVFAGETVDLADLGYPQCAGTKIPAASADAAVGGPTVADYVQKCETGDAPPPGRPAHVADYVIPGSIVLIGAGVLGTVWVVRGYKP